VWFAVTPKEGSEWVHGCEKLGHAVEFMGNDDLLQLIKVREVLPKRRKAGSR